MKIFLDTADIGQIREIAAWGILDGVTTNPTLIAKAGKEMKAVLSEICAVVAGDVNAEVIALDRDGIVREGRELAQLDGKIVVKIPITKDGLLAGKILADEGIRVNFTLVFSANQALLAAKAGAAFVTPFVGRLDSAGQNGMELIREIRTIVDNFDFNMHIIVGSIRHPSHVLESALIGADIVTVPYGTLTALLQHPMTDQGIEQFMRDWESFKKSTS